MQRRFQRSHSDHGVCAALPGVPLDFPDVNAGGEALLAPHSVGALRHRMPMERAGIVVFDEDVHRAIFVIPAEVQLFLSGHRGTIEEDLQPDRKVLLDVQRGMIAQIRVVERRNEGRGVIVVVVVIIVVVVRGGAGRSAGKGRMDSGQCVEGK